MEQQMLATARGEQHKNRLRKQTARYLQQVETAQPLGYLQVVRSKLKDNSCIIACFPFAENNYYIRNVKHSNLGKKICGQVLLLLLIKFYPHGMIN